MSGKPHNRLIKEKSPYLLQHAGNPVDWYPWGEEAFEKAKDESKPIFLSIGYSSCHWCHVMEQESFEDHEVAALMNRYFVAIKVDREERPDIDSFYMAICQSMTGSGGWPLTIMMSPEKKPFFAGTYFPKDSWHSHPGLMQLLRIIADAWENSRENLLQTGDRIVQSLKNHLAISRAGKLSGEILEHAARILEQNFDETHGGFGPAPKFPIPHQLSFLFRCWKRSGSTRALEMAEKTLDAMMRGGMYDHLGFGFHRYSTDREWSIPHFEKMLYDQALLAIAYIEAHQITGKRRYARVAQEIFSYVMRDMTSPDGAFYSSEDADSEGMEGKFYTWTIDEIMESIGGEDAELMKECYGITAQGNFEGANVLMIRRTAAEYAEEKGILTEELEKRLAKARESLFYSRCKRVRPSKDDKILADWNGLMIASLARGAQAFNMPEHAAAARRAADFILKFLRNPDGTLLHRYRDGEATTQGYLNDHAFLVWGLLELYEATFNPSCLKEAIAISEKMIDLFWDESSGGFFMTEVNDTNLPARTKEVYDGAIPSGNSIAALNLLRLASMTGRKDMAQRALQTLESFGATIDDLPSAFTQSLIALDYLIGPTREIVIAGEPDDEMTLRMLGAIHSRFIPGKVLILHPESGEGEEIEEIIPFLKNLGKIGGKTAAYICSDHRCTLPTVDFSEMISLLESSNNRAKREDDPLR